MVQETRDDRLQADLQALQDLKENSSLFDFESTGDPPDRYTIVFRGKGLARNSSSNSDVEVTELHRCDIRLPYSYPERAPDVRWLTPIFHPNISFSGFINMKEIGMPWDKGLTLDVVCERLWDVARLSYMNLDKATNYAAKSYFESDNAIKLPVDSRLLRGGATPAGSNVIHYERRGGAGVKLPDARPSSADVLFIGDDAAKPPVHAKPTRPPVVRRDDDDILFIE